MSDTENINNEEEENEEMQTKKVAAKRMVIDDSDSSDAEECAFAERLEESQDELKQPSDAAATKRVIERTRATDNERAIENKKRRVDLEERMLSHANQGDTSCEEDGSDSESSLLPENRKKNKKVNRGLCLDDIDFNNDEHMIPKVRPVSTRLTITAILKERGLFALDLLRDAELAAYLSYVVQQGNKEPQTAIYLPYGFNTFEYEETDQVENTVHGFLSDVVTQVLQMMAKKKLALGWKTLFNEPASDAALQQSAPKKPEVVTPVAPKQPQWEAKDIQNNNNGLRRSNGMESSGGNNSNSYGYGNNYSNNNKQYGGEQFGYQQGRANGGYDSNYNGGARGSYGQNFNAPAPYNKENGFVSAANIQNNGNSSYGHVLSANNAQYENGNKPYSSDRAQPPIIMDVPEDRIFVGGVCTDLGILDAIGRRLTEQLSGTMSTENITQRVEDEFKRFKLRVGEGMPKRSTVRPRDDKRYNIYTSVDLEDMRTVAKRVAVSFGLQGF